MRPAQYDEIEREQHRRIRARTALENQERAEDALRENTFGDRHPDFGVGGATGADVGRSYAIARTEPLGMTDSEDYDSDLTDTNIEERTEEAEYLGGGGRYMGNRLERDEGRDEEEKDRRRERDREREERQMMGREDRRPRATIPVNFRYRGVRDPYEGYGAGGNYNL